MIKLTKEQKLEGLKWTIENFDDQGYWAVHICYRLEDYLIEIGLLEDSFCTIYYEAVWKSFFSEPYEHFAHLNNQEREPRIKFLKEQIKLLENDN